VYSHLHTATLPGNASTAPIVPASNGCLCHIQDMNLLAVALRMHKDFLP
jgi:hypothetical protein